jgi:hypothetical protein
VWYFKGINKIRNASEWSSLKMAGKSRRVPSALRGF